MPAKHRKTKNAAEYGRGEITRDILRIIATGIVADKGRISPNVIQVLNVFDPKGRAQRNKIWKAIKYLESQERIRIHEEQGQRILILTKRGQLALNELSIDELSVKPPRMWDKKWRLVMFDIPMYKSQNRIPFREKIQDLGFAMYQKSVWVYPYECRDEVLMVAEHYEVREYIRYLIVEEMSNMQEFIRKFDLQ